MIDGNSPLLNSKFPIIWLLLESLIEINSQPRLLELFSSLQNLLISNVDISIICPNRIWS